MKLQFLLNNVYAANAKWRLVEKSSLDQPVQTALADILADENIFGIFKICEQDNSAAPKIAYKDVALLFYYLQTPSPLPAFIQDNYDDETNAMIAKLICEEVLCIQTKNGFVSGIDATSYIFKNNDDDTLCSKGILSRISEQAMAYAIQLKNVDQSFLNTALYTYNTLPVLHEERIKNVERFLGIGFNTDLELALLQYWAKHLPTTKYNWIMWNRKNITGTNNQNGATYKLYISCALQCFPEVFHKTARLLSSTKAIGFKTGADHHGMARPDRFVIYFYSYADMMEAAVLLREALTGYPAQGVPFTAALDESGIISWGIDPPATDVIQQLEGGSWRAGIAEKIAATIMQARKSNLSKKEILDFVQQKLATEGIDGKWRKVQGNESRICCTDCTDEHR